MISKKNIEKNYYLFIFSHLLLWVLIPSFSNINLPLDTIEALAWGSNLNWGFDKHPPLSAFATEFFFIIFKSNDWAYYLLSQLFVITAFLYVWKLSNEIFKEKIYALISVLVLESIFFLNFTTPEFNVNVSQLPFWALTVYFFWKSINQNKIIHWLLFGIFSALGFLSKYLFIYLLFSIFLFIAFNFKDTKKLLSNYLLSIFVSLVALAPHFFWLYENNFVTISYAFNRSDINENSFTDHIINPLIFMFKQTIILIPLLVLFLILLKKVKTSYSFKNKKFNFLFFISIVPILLILITSIVLGANIRTMWMTPFYLFIGVFLINLYQKKINFKKLKTFFITFLFLFFLSPGVYLAVSIIDKTKRTDYPGKEIARLVQDKWDQNFINEIRIVVGDEWSAGNLSYHLPSRPMWFNDLKDKAINIEEQEGVIYTGNSKILKKVCPGVFGTIKPVGYCMIGKR